MDENCESRSESRKQEWGKEKPKLDKARRLRGIYFIDPDDDEEYKETLKNAGRKLERLAAPAMLCKRFPSSITKVFAKSEITSEKTPETVCG